MFYKLIVIKWKLRIIKWKLRIIKWKSIYIEQTIKQTIKQWEVCDRRVLERAVAPLVKQPPTPQPPEGEHFNILYFNIPQPPEGAKSTIFNGRFAKRIIPCVFPQYSIGVADSCIIYLGACAARVLRVRTAIFTSQIYHFNQLIENNFLFTPLLLLQNNVNSICK